MKLSREGLFKAYVNIVEDIGYATSNIKQGRN